MALYSNGEVQSDFKMHVVPTLVQHPRFIRLVTGRKVDRNSWRKYAKENIWWMWLKVIQETRETGVLLHRVDHPITRNPYIFLNPQNSNKAARVLSFWNEPVFQKTLH